MRVSRDYQIGAVILGVELALSVLYFLISSTNVQDAVYELFGGGCVVAIAWAIRHYRPRPSLPWIVFGIANVLFVAGDIAFDISPNASQQIGRASCRERV